MLYNEAFFIDVVKRDALVDGIMREGCSSREGRCSHSTCNTSLMIMMIHSSITTH
ncbi:hypothetical protein HanRHA438_Chr02g0054941 [Helianthus annuus]|nr:hypothetical protein HanRHA438_Chr02g0054941 [Helianthus annuus]